MKEYLKHFFARFHYTAEDTATLTAAYETVAGSCYSERWEELLRLYDQSMIPDFEAMLSEARAIAEELRLHPYTLELLLFLCLSRRTEQYYAAQGIAPAIFENSMLDLRYKLEECKLVKGICGSFVAMWFPGFFDLTRFALGRLQFELVPFNETYEKNGKKLTPESTVINVHIPRTGTPMTPKDCDKAFALAADFFRDRIKGDIAFVCHSWLLFPPLLAYLSEKTNTVAFARRFDIVSLHEHEDSHPDVWRLFDTDYTGDPDALPADSSFRRAYIQFLKDGKKSGYAYGVFFY